MFREARFPIVVPSLVLGVLCAMGSLGMGGSIAQAAEDAVSMGDAKAGKRVFNKCKACHEVGPDAKAKVGPPLTGIVGRPAASIEGFSYSEAMTAKGADGLVWSPENINHMLTKPKDFVPGTKMSFVGLRKDKERADVIAYLASFATE